MGNVSRFALLLALLASPMLAEQVTAVKAQRTGSAGVTDGIIVTVGDRLVFVDEQRAELSFAVSKSDVRSLSTQSGGTLTAEIKEPFLVHQQVRQEDPQPAGAAAGVRRKPSHSRRWTYGELDKLDRNRDENKVILEGRDGRKESFKTDQMMDEVVYKSIADRIVAARAVR